MVMKFRTPYNSRTMPKTREKNTQPSLTVPDQSMSVKEIMDRYARGLPISGQKVPVYNGDQDDMPDLQRLDLAEIQELREAAQQNVESIKKNLFTKQRAAKETTPLKQAELNLSDDNTDDRKDQPVKKTPKKGSKNRPDSDQDDD